MPNVNKQQLIFVIEGLMDPTTRPGTIKMASPILGQAIAEVLTSGLDRSLQDGQAEAKRQLGGIFQQGLAGNPGEKLKGSAQGIVKETAKGFMLGIIDHFVGD